MATCNGLCLMPQDQGLGPPVPGMQDGITTWDSFPCISSIRRKHAPGKAQVPHTHTRGPASGSSTANRLFPGHRAQDLKGRVCKGLWRLTVTYEVVPLPKRTSNSGHFTFQDVTKKQVWFFCRYPVCSSSLAINRSSLGWRNSWVFSGCRKQARRPATIWTPVHCVGSLVCWRVHQMGRGWGKGRGQGLLPRWGLA